MKHFKAPDALTGFYGCGILVLACPGLKIPANFSYHFTKVGGSWYVICWHLEISVIGHLTWVKQMLEGETCLPAPSLVLFPDQLEEAKGELCTKYWRLPVWTLVTNTSPDLCRHPLHPKLAGRKTMQGGILVNFVSIITAAKPNSICTCSSP